MIHISVRVFHANAARSIHVFLRHMHAFGIHLRSIVFVWVSCYFNCFVGKHDTFC